MGVIKSKHTSVYVVTGPTAATKLTRVRGGGFPDGQASEIDISDFDDDFDQFVSGRKATGSTSFEVIYDPTDHAPIEALYLSGATAEFMILAPLSETAPAVAPTVLASAFEPVTAVTNKKFSGFVQNFAVTVQDNDVWRATITIKGSGTVTTTVAP